MERMQARARARYAFAEFLGGCGKRCTPERLSVLDCALDQRTPFLAEELLESGCGAVSRATVFNTLPLLVQAGLLRRSPGSSRYEAVRSAAARKPRINLVCSLCGKTHHRAATGFADWLSEQDMRGFTPSGSGSEIYIYGECSRCRRKSSSSKPKFITHNIDKNPTK